MSEHLSQTQLAGYSGRTLEPDELLAVDRHLASCDVCHQRLLQGLSQPPQLAVTPSFASGEGPFHLDYAQHLEPYVDGKANEIDREIVDSHVAECLKCAAELKDLLAFKQQPVVATRASARTPSRWKQSLSQWRQLPSPANAMAAVVAVFIVATMVFWWNTSPTSQRVEQAETPPPPSEKPVQTPDKPSTASTEHTPAVPPREESLIVLNDAGGEVMVNQRGQLEGLPELPPDLRESVERVLATRQLRASPALTEWTTGAGNLRGGFEKQNTFVPLSPTDVVIETDRPTFRWQPLETGSEYVVTVYDCNLHKVGSSGPLHGTQWTIPHTLERGITFSWQISAMKDGKTVVSPKPPLPEARFKILDQPALDTLAKLKQAPRRSHLALGVFYWKHGLIEEAEREFQALAKANPVSAAAKELFASIRSLRRR